MILTSCEQYGKLSKFCAVVSSVEMEGYVNVKLPFNLSGYRLYDVLDVSEAPFKTVSFDGIKYDCVHPWIDVPWDNLNKTSGLHVYKLSFMHKCNNKFFTTYISYLAQDSNAEKPYLYVKDRYNESDEDKVGLYV